MKRAEKGRLNRVQGVREGIQDLIKTHTNQNVCHIWLYWNITYSNGLNDPFMTPENVYLWNLCSNSENEPNLKSDNIVA